MGLIGSMHFVKYPPVPIEQISLNINIEQIGSKNRDFPGVWAIGSPPFREPFDEVGKLIAGTELKFDSIDGMVDIITGCDTYRFYEKKYPQ